MKELTTKSGGDLPKVAQSIREPKAPTVRVRQALAIFWVMLHSLGKNIRTRVGECWQGF